MAWNGNDRKFGIFRNFFCFYRNFDSLFRKIPQIFHVLQNSLLLGREIEICGKIWGGDLRKCIFLAWKKILIPHDFCRFCRKLSFYYHFLQYEEKMSKTARFSTIFGKQKHFAKKVKIFVFKMVYSAHFKVIFQQKFTKYSRFPISIQYFSKNIIILGQTLYILRWFLKQLYLA